MKSSIIGIIAILLVFNIFSPIAMSANPEQRSKLINFNSYTDIEYDLTSLDEPLVIDKAINVPLTIQYWTDVPEDFLRLMPWRIRNYILFGNMIEPAMEIHIEVIDKPDLVDVSISQPDISVDIPRKGTVKETYTSLLISPREEAQAIPQSIVLKVESETVGKINGFEIEETVRFTPAYVPSLTITPSTSSVTVPPNKKTIIPIEVKNKANKLSRITPSIVDNLSDLSIKLNPPLLHLDIDETGTINVEVEPPSNFQGKRTVQIDFAIEQFPKREGFPVGAYSIDIDLYYEPEYTEDDDLNLYVIFGIVLIIIIISFFIFGRYRGYW